MRTGSKIELQGIILPVYFRIKKNTFIIEISCIDSVLYSQLNQKEVRMLKGKFLAIVIFFMVGSLALFTADIRLGPTINFVPANPHVGDTVSIQTGILSVGGISKNVRIITKMGNTVIFNQLYPEFADNNAVSINVNWVATLGTHTVKFLIDSVDASTPDTNTTNNEVSKTFTILAQITSAGRSPGTVNQPGSPGHLTRTSPVANLALQPCFTHQNEPTDLAVSDFHVAQFSATQWKITAKIRNNGQRCLKSVLWRVENLGKIVVTKREGSPSNPGWVLQNADEISVEKIVNADANPATFPANGHTMTRFKIIVDPDHEISDPTPGNNTATFDMLLL
jgi:hypothetical protein